MARTAGTRLGRYELVRRLGRGGMGEVWESILHGPRGFRRPVALKLLRAGPATREADQALIAEARLGAMLSHPNVVAVHDLGSADGQWYVAMERVDGRSVRDLATGPLPARAIVEVGLQTAAGLAHVHGLDSPVRAAIVHRDIKPSNLLVDRTGVLKIVDLGIARWSDDDAEAEGTYGYVAPEQQEGASEPRSDLFSLGVVLYELAAGERPFGTGLPAALATIEVEDHLTDPRFLGALGGVPGLAQVVQGCLRFSPEARWRDARALLGALRGVLARLPPGPGLADVSHRMAVGQPQHHDGHPAEPPTVLLASPLPRLHDVFVGRDDERAALTERLDSGARLVTLLGPGGMGKTRLALQVAHARLGRGGHGARFCDLTEAADHDAVLRAVARAFDVLLPPDQPTRHLGDAIARCGDCLVVLDNAETGHQAVRAIVRRWLDQTDRARFLVTSRVPLGTTGEHVLSLGPLDPDAAVALFQSRAPRPAPEADLTAVRRLAAALDHHPLALELAAARTRMLSVAQLLERLQDRFRLLTDPTSDRPARHRSLAAAIAGSVEALGPHARAALVQLSVCRGGFTLEAAEALVDVGPDPEAPWVLDLLQELIDQSLLTTQGSRFTLLESVRQFAAGLGGEAEHAPTRARHAAWFARFGATHRDYATRGGGERWLRLADELENVVAACRWAVGGAGDPEVVVGTLRAAWAVLERRGPVREALALAEHVHGQATDPQVICEAARVLAHASSLAGDTRRAHELFDQVHALAVADGDIGAQAHALRHLVQQDRRAGRTQAAMERADRALALAREASDTWLEGSLLFDRGTLLRDLGRAAESRAQMLAALEVHRQTGNRRAEALALSGIGLGEGGQEDDARERQTLALAIFVDLADRRGEALTQLNLGTMEAGLGRYDEAARMLTAAAAAVAQLGDQRLEGYARANLGIIQSWRGRPGASAAELEQAVTLARDRDQRLLLSTLVSLAHSRRLMGDLQGVRAALREGREVFATLPELPHLESTLWKVEAGLAADEGDLQGALALLERVGGTEPVRASEGHEPLRARIEEASGDLAAAEATLRAALVRREAIDDGPAVSHLRVQLAHLLLRLDRLDDAVEVAGQLAGENAPPPQGTPLALLRCELAARRGDATAADRARDLAEALDATEIGAPARVAAWCTVGRVLAASDRSPAPALRRARALLGGLAHSARSPLALGVAR